MDRKDIEEFLRRSNSICDQTNSDTEGVVTVRRMSLKEFTGLDPSSKDQIADLSTPSWKSTVSSSLISSYSARRRSVLSNDFLESPSKRLATQMEESIDLPTAINRVSSLRQRLSEIERPEVIPFDDSPVVRLKLLDESRRMSVITKELFGISFSSDVKWITTLAEITDCADSLTTSALTLILHSSVYHSQLIATEISQVLSSLHSTLCCARAILEACDDQSVFIKSTTNLQSAVNQLIHALSSMS